LFGTNEFLQSNAQNISCSLIRITEFIKQRNITDCNRNKIPQIDSFGEAALTFIQAIYEAGWNKLHTTDKTSIECKIKMQFVKLGLPNTNPSKRNMIKKISPSIPAHLSHKQLEEIKKHMEQRKRNKNKAKSYAQAFSPTADILKLRDAFPALPDKKIIEIHRATPSKKSPKGRKIQITTKGPFRKQAINLISAQYLVTIMNNAGFHVSTINSWLKEIKSTLRAEFMQPLVEDLIITTNNIPAASDLSTMEKYIKFIKGINHNDVSAPQLSQSKSYLKITGILYIQPSGLTLTSDDITNYLKNSDLFEDTSLASKLHIIKASPKSDMAIVWIDIWDSQSGSKTKLLINYSFNYGRSIATIRGTNMNLEVPQYHNCWK